MSAVFNWNDLIAEVLRHFPSCDDRALRANPGDIGALIMHLSKAHDLTFAEAAEMVAIRLPVFVETAPWRLSA